MDLTNYKNYRTTLKITNGNILTYTDKDNKFIEIFDRRSVHYKRGEVIAGEMFGEPTFSGAPKKRNFPASLFIKDTLPNVNLYLKECKDKTFMFTFIFTDKNFPENYPEMLKNCYDNKITPNIITTVRAFDDLECLLINEFCGYIGIEVDSLDNNTLEILSNNINKLSNYECSIMLFFNIKRHMLNKLFSIIRTNKFGLPVTYIVIRFDKDIKLTDSLLPTIKCINDNPKILIDVSEGICENIVRGTYPARLLDLEYGKFTAYIENRIMKDSKNGNKSIEISTIKESWDIISKEEAKCLNSVTEKEKK